MTNSHSKKDIVTLSTTGEGEEAKTVEDRISFPANLVPHPDAPPERPYRFNHGQLRDLQVGMEIGANILITGPTGCGKTSLPIALAAQLGKPVIRFNCNGETRVAGMVGKYLPKPKDGVATLEFHYGALVRALRDGYWIIFDEIDAAPPNVLMVLQPVLEEGQATLHIPETDEMVVAHPNAQIFATGNTLGYRASTRASYAGTNVMNNAFLDRFGVVISADYPSRVEEQERIKVNVPTADQDIVEGMCRTAESLRKDKAFRSDFSTRRLIQWARLVPFYKDKDGNEDVLGTFELSIVRKLTSASNVRVARETVRRVFGYGE